MSVYALDWRFLSGAGIYDETIVRILFARSLDEATLA